MSCGQPDTWSGNFVIDTPCKTLLSVNKLISLFVNIKLTCLMQYIPLDYDSAIQNWSPNARYTLQTENGRWNVGLNFTNGRKRFSTGWNKFVRGNNLQKGDMLNFKFYVAESHFWIRIWRFCSHET